MLMCDVMWRSLSAQIGCQTETKCMVLKEVNNMP